MTLVEKQSARHQFKEDVINLRELGEKQFASSYTFMPTKYHPGGFGGDMLAQCVEACRRTVDERFNLHSMHGYFLRPRKPDADVILQVSTINDGTTFSSRSVTAYQNSKVIFSLQASFHQESKETPNPIMEWQQGMPDVKLPEDLEPMSEIMWRYRDNDASPWRNRLTMFRNMAKMLSIDIRFVNPEGTLFKIAGAEKLERLWIRMKDNLGSKQNIHRSAALYCCDFQAQVVHFKAFPDIDIYQVASVDHSMWFHRDVNMNEWNLLETRSVTMSNCRGLTHGYIWNRRGELVASIVQEGLTRSKL